MIVQQSVSGRVMGLLVVLALVGIASGAATITSTGSVDPLYNGSGPLITPVLEVAISAYGEVSVTGGAQVAAGSVFIAGPADALDSGDLQQGPEGLVTVAGSGSSLTTILEDNSGDLFVGYTGDGTLSVESNAQVSTGGLIIGAGPDATGNVLVGAENPIVPDTASLTAQFNLLVGVWANEANLTIRNGGSVTAGRLQVGGIETSEAELSPELEAQLDPIRGNGTVTVESGSTLDVPGPAYIGYSDTGTVNVTGGTVTTYQTAVGLGPISTGTLTVDGAAGAAQYNVTQNDEYEAGEGSPKSGALIIGAYGNGTATIRNGGQVTADRAVYVGGFMLGELPFTGQIDGEDLAASPDGVGTLTIQDDGSSLTTPVLAVGATGHGILDLHGDSEGQAFLTTTEAGLGVAAGSVGEATVGNEGSWANSGSMFVGGSGTGTLTVQSGGHVDVGSILFIGGHSSSDITSPELYSGDQPNGTGTVTVQGNGTLLDADHSQLEAFGIGVGSGGNGILQIQNGGRVDSQVSVIGDDEGSTGTVIVDGANSLWRLSGEDELPDDITAPGSGTVTVSNGGTIQVGANGLLLVGTADDGGQVTVGSTGQGTVTLANGGSVQSGELIIGGTLPPGEVTAQQLQAGGFDSGTGTVEITGAASQWDTGDGDVVVGLAGTGTLNVTDGQVTSRAGWVGVTADGVGIATITGTTATWTNQDAPQETLGVGVWGTGTLNIEGGAQVTASEVSIGGVPLSFFETPFDPDINMNGTGTVNVTGAGSTLTVTGTETLYVGYSGTGTLNVQDQGQVNTESVVIGAGPDIVGTVNVDGAGSEMTVTDNATVGAWGEGHLTISNHGEVTADSLYIGGLTDDQLAGVDPAIQDAFDAPTGTGFVTVTGSGSTLSVASGTTLVVGARGTGTLTIADQGVVTAQDSIIGDLAGSTGTAGVTGAGSQWQTGDLIVGSLGTGTLNISGGGLVTSNNASVGAAAGSTGTVNVAGTNSQWNVGGDLFVGGSPTVAGGTGLLAVTDGGLVDVTGEMTVWETGTLRGNGTVTVQADDTLHNYGTIAPGTPTAIGTLTVNGNVVFEDGSTYDVKLGPAGTSDKLVASGDVTINDGSTLHVTSLGTVLGEHDYDILQANTVTIPEGGTGFDLSTALLGITGPFYADDAVTLHVVAANFDDPTIVETPNQQQLGGALQQIAGAGSNTVTTALQQVETPEELRAAYDQLSGQSRPPLAPLAATGTSRFLGTVSDRVQSLQTGFASGMSHTSLFAMSGPNSRTGDGRMSESAAGGQSVAVGNGSNILADSPWGLWGRGYGLFGDRETERDAPGYTYHMYGGSLGLDYQLTETFLGGVVFGVTNGDVDFAGVRDTTDLEVYHVGLYGNFTSGKWYLNSMATYGHVQYDTERFVDLTSERLTGDLNGNDWSAYVEVGQNLPLGLQTVLQPLASLQYSYLGLDSYTETGGVSALSYDDQSYQSVKGSLGARLTRQLFESVSGCRGDGQLRARWVHEFGDSQSSVDTSFASNPAAVFTIRDGKIARDSAIVGAGLGVNLTKQLRASADYDALLNADETVQMISAALEYRW